MPAKSKNQQKAMGAALAIKRGKVKPQKNTVSTELANALAIGQLEEFASTPTKRLPKRVKKKKR